MLRRFIFTLSAGLFGGFLYCLVEILFRGYTHVSMYVLGGVCFLCIGSIRRTFSDAFIAQKMLLCAGVITLFEFLCGMLVNVRLGLGVWDYSAMPMNVLGQVCITYTAAWCLLAVPAMGLDLLLCRYAWNMPRHMPEHEDNYDPLTSSVMYSSRYGMRKLTNSSM